MTHFSLALQLAVKACKEPTQSEKAGLLFLVLAPLL